jgi:hypothetical protein
VLLLFNAIITHIATELTLLRYTGVTRRSVLDLAQTWSHISADADTNSSAPQATLTVSERAITMGEVAAAAKAGRLQEVLACS